jgi:hypothetical protein
VFAPFLLAESLKSAQAHVVLIGALAVGQMRKLPSACIAASLSSLTG